MNRFAVLSALLVPLVLTGSRLASGQSTHSLSLEALAISAGNTVSNAASSQSGTTGRSLSTANVRLTKAKETLQINVHNFGMLPDNAHVEWYFVAAPVHPEPGKAAAEQEFVFDHGAKDLVLPGNATQTITAESQEVTSAVRSSSRGRSSGSSRRSSGFAMPRAGQKPQESGSALRGWMVRVVADGKVIAARGSNQAYEDLAKDNVKLADLADNEAPPAVGARSYKKTVAKKTSN